jgi:hypothetical protein
MLASNLVDKHQGVVPASNACVYLKHSSSLGAQLTVQRNAWELCVSKVGRDSGLFNTLLSLLFVL